MEPLSDPKKDRIVKTVPLPPHKPITPQLLFTVGDKINIALLKEHLKKQGRVAKPEFVKIIRIAAQILKNQPTMAVVQDPVTIVGDIHGQYYDFLKLLQVGGNPEQTKYLFLGDYVDRGSFSIEVIILIFALKINYPDTVTLLRGNHQCRQLTGFFNFRAECLHKYDQDIYDMLMGTFDLLPLACLLNNKFFCTHGGISPELKTLDQIKKIDRVKEIPKNGIFCDLMWADPVDNNDGFTESKIKQNDVRGCSYFFGYQLAKEFLQKNKLISIIRAHQAQIEGYKMYKWGGANHFPTVITLFSAPNYCDVYHNKGAVIKFSNNQLNIQQYNNQPHPYLLPNFLNVFSWSIPFVAQKVSQIFLLLIKPTGEIKQVEVPAFQQVDSYKLVQALLDLQKQQKQKNQKLVELEGLCLDDKLIQTGVVQAVKEQKVAGKLNKESFIKNKGFDIKNQKRPQQS